MNKHVTDCHSQNHHGGKFRRIIASSKEVLAKLRVGKGDTLCLTETPDGILLHAL